MPRKPTATDKYSAINQSGEYLAITPAVERFVARDQAARAALEAVLAGLRKAVR